MTYSIIHGLNYIANENDKGVLVKKEMAVAITVNIEPFTTKFLEVHNRHQKILFYESFLLHS